MGTNRNKTSSISFYLKVHFKREFFRELVPKEVDLTHALDITNEKMINLQEVGADALTEVCPFCQLQFDRGQVEIQDKFGIAWGLPVLHYNELLGLAQGMSPDELALDLHAVDVEPFLKKIL